MNKSISKISVLGCGWLGLPLAEKLLHQGYVINGSTTDVSKLTLLKDAGINPFHIIIDTDKAVIDNNFFKSDLLIVNIPPKRIEGIEEIYPAKIQIAMQLALEHGVGKVIFTSSTSVYPNLNREVKEEDAINPEKASGCAVLKAEDIIRDFYKGDATIIRLGGLIADDRNPLYSLQKKKLVVPKNAPVNLIHRDDCIDIISKIIDKEKWGYTFNACAPKHPSRAEFYAGAAKKLELPLPKFSDEKNNYKIVESRLLIKELNYSFKYPNPEQMY